ncbi:putative bifunctional diguanylate cyclase/phosphodiesterase [Klenkia soli]|nr:bifunctional diguanylate cyclase/phosphodiesterase [Klenkia soli]
MRLRSSTGSTGRGVPLSVYVTALVLVPLLGVLALTGALVRSAVARSDSAAEAARSVAAVAVLERVRAAVEQEVVPVLTVAALDSPELVEQLGLPAMFVATARTQAAQGLDTARAATDAALAEVPADSSAAAAASSAVAALDSLRGSGSDQRTVDDVVATYEGYLQLSDDLALAQRQAGEGARDEDVSATTRAAVADVALLSRAAQAAGREMPLFLSSLTEIDVAVAADQWLSARAEYRAAAAALAGLTAPEAQEAWAAAEAEGPVPTVDAVLDAQAVPGAAPLTILGLQDLVTQSNARSTVVADVLGAAVVRAEDAAVADQAAARSTTTTTAVVCGALVLLTALVVAVVWRSLSRSLRRLAGRAQDVSEGTLVDVEVGGPREVRTVSSALRAAVASLRRIQDQAGAVARGDLDHALLDEPLPGPLGEVVHASVQQIVTAVRQRQELQSALTHQAQHDALTELPNRAQALRLAAAALHRAQRSGAMIGLLFVDLDGFKAVNDGFGHAAGDEVLRQTAHRLHDAVRSGDVVCRLGGDEFVVLVEPAESEDDLMELATRLVETVSAPITVGTSTVAVGASVGIATSRDASTDADALLAQADAAVYRAKASGRGRAELFDEALRAQLVERSELQAAIAAGLAGGEMRLVYQPVHDVGSGAVIGYEALIRWDRPGHGTVPPDLFIGAAEASRLICDLDRWVLAEATAQLAAWRSAPGPARPGEPTVAVNISGRHLVDSRVVADVAAALEASGLPAELLVLEVTETVLVDDPTAYDHLATLRATGVGIAIDDFGTGYTSIGQLRSMPVDTLKIDRSFIASDEPSHRTLVGMMIHAAHAFGLTVVAEGVEEPCQLEALRAESCDQVQGYLMSRPVPPAQAGAAGSDGVRRVRAQEAVPAGGHPQVN